MRLIINHRVLSDMEKKIKENNEIPFGAKDSELYKFEYTIPEGYEAEIKDGKVIVKKKESEDERIMKEIVDFIYWAIDRGSITNEQRERSDSWLAYLEKKKEQKPESCDCSRDEESYTNGIHHVLMNPEAYGLIKQKPAEQLGGTFTSYDMAKTFTEGQNYVIAHPEKFGLCKPAEWKEEDDALLKEIVSFFKDGTVKLQHDLNLYAGFLEKKFKSLRPQPHWKPSEEQMEYLAKGIIILGEDGNCKTSAVLNELRNDLQKLL